MSPGVNEHGHTGPGEGGGQYASMVPGLCLGNARVSAPWLGVCGETEAQMGEVICEGSRGWRGSPSLPSSHPFLFPGC